MGPGANGIKNTISVSCKLQTKKFLTMGPRDQCYK